MTVVVSPAKTSGVRLPRTLRRCLTVLLAAALIVAMPAALASHRHAFAHAIGGVSKTTLLLASALHLVSVVARSEAWAVSVRAAGATLRRRTAYQIASLGFAANVLSPSLGAAVRIWALRTKAGDQAPSAPALVAAEVPVLAIQALASALMSVSLVGPLGAPWWTPVLVLGAAGGLLVAVSRVARRGRGRGAWRGLAALRTGRDRCRICASVALIAICESTRNLLVLHAVGLPAGPVDAVALLVGAGLLGALPIGPGSSAGAAMLIFGAAGVGPAAAAGVLLTATGFAADVGYAAWGAGDMLWRSCPVRLRRLPRAADLGAAICCAGVALTAVALT
jgi:uncharacterized membrane protein YbhN (UPF0104 family)